VNPEFLSRLQFALTASFHFIFPPISMGLGIMLVWMAWKHVRTGDPVWRQSSVFWVKVYGLVFALGIATGLVQVELVAAEPQGAAAGPEGDRLHAEHADVEVHGLVEVGHGQDQVIDAVDPHRCTPAAGLPVCRPG
jgi:hypothetical protein